MAAFETVVIFLTAVALATGRPSENKSLMNMLKNNGLGDARKVITKRSLETEGDSTVLPKTINVPMDIRQMDNLNEFLQCTSCLTECINVRESVLSYFLCKQCISKCAQNIDAFMQLFAAHRCEPIVANERPEPETQPRAEHRVQPAAENQTGSGMRVQQDDRNTDYLDEYMDEHFASNEEDMCALKQAKYNKMEQQLNNCVNNLATREERSLDFPETVDFMDGWLPNNPAEPRIPTTPARLPNSDPPPVQQGFDPIPDPTRDDEGALNDPTSPALVSTPDPHLVEELSKEILEKHAYRFVSKEKLSNLTSHIWTTNPTQLKSIHRSVHGMRRERKHAVCPSSFVARSPDTALHQTGLSVDLYKTDDFVQVFWVAECQFSMPIVKVVEGASCEIVHGKRRAIFLTSEKRATSPNSGFSNCVRHLDGTGRYRCDDWVHLPAACSIFVWR